MNFYGATELTVLNTFFEVPDPAPPGVQRVGRARPDTQAFVLRAGRVAGVGEIGEVVLRSNFCTRGYLHDPARTAERFLANPASGDPRDRLYRTGDRGRLRPDGALEVLGRLDDQVKVRGVRVELGEVKAALLRHPAVLEAEVVPRKTDLLDDLVAYLVFRPGADVDPDVLRAHVAAILPPALVPGAFVRLAALPLTANGKVDRAALPPPEAAAARPRRAAATATEEALLALWRDLLPAPDLGVDDNFFDVGGHSLLATRIVSRVRARFGVELTVRAFFTDPTVARLAARIDALLAGDDRDRGAL
jgi:acyl-coenzyme A synthetase/AMP-(fatty) acid ligase